MKQFVNYNELKKERLIISCKQTQLLKRRNYYSQNKKLVCRFIHYKHYTLTLYIIHKINECQLYQRIATEGMIYQISSGQSNVKGQKFFQYKKSNAKKYQ